MEKHVNHNMGDDHIIQTCLNSSAVVGAIMMLISYWMDGYGFLSGAAAYRLRPLWIYSLCMILAMFGVPVMCAGLWAWDRIIRSIKTKLWVRVLFRVSAVSYAG